MTADVSCQCNGVTGQAYIEMLGAPHSLKPQLCWDVKGKFYTISTNGNVIICVNCQSMVAARSAWK